MNKKSISVGIILILLLGSGQSALAASIKDFFIGKGRRTEQTAPQAPAPVPQEEKEHSALVEENENLKSLLAELRSKNATVLNEYKKLKIDRDNLLSQTQRMLKEKEDVQGMKEAHEALVKEKEAFAAEKERLLKNKATLLREKADLEQKNEDLMKNVDQLKFHFQTLLKEKGHLEELLAEANAQQGARIKELAKSLKLDFSKLKDELASARRENTALNKTLNMVQKESKRTEKDNVTLKQNVKLLENEVEDLKRQNEQAGVENRHLTQEARMFPEKFAELARQNQKLVTETADMHYNLGVFYVQNDEYGRAIKEFEKALDLNPDNANANYNLGYIYAEHLVDREKAIQYFRNYLTFAPDAKDAEWIRKYILTWQTWYGKEAIK